MRFGFKNIRQFSEISPLEILNNTYLVGCNNSGKSSYHKSLMLMIDNLKNLTYANCTSNLHMPIFRFDSNGTFALHLGTIKDILPFNKHDNEMKFEMTLELDEVVYDFIIGRESDLAVIEKASIKKHIKENDYCIISIDFIHLLVAFECFDSINCEENDHHKEKYTLNISIDDLIYRYFNPNKNISIFCVILSLLKDYFKETESYLNHKDINKYKYSHAYVTSNGNIDLYFSQELQNYLQDFSNSISKSIDTLDYDYIYAHISEGNTLFHSVKGDYLSSVINEFYQSGVYENKLIVQYLENWMKEFEIGETFDINVINGEYYNVNIDGHGLQYKGLGTRQFFSVLLKVGILMKDINPASYLVVSTNFPADEIPIFLKSFKDSWGSNHTFKISDYDKRYEKIMQYSKQRCNQILIFEEPEQNMHPKLQSKLALFFLEISRILNCTIIIETHSEYLIRRTQLKISELGIKDEEKLQEQIPFAVYYFPSNANPYQMHYKVNGLFEEKFGTGFFDEAGKMQMTILKNGKN